jgi:hypothetical protein
MVLKDNKTYLTMVTPTSQIQARQVDVVDNDGKMLRLLSGVQPGEMVALNVGDTIPDGGKVRPIIETADPAKASPSPAVSAEPAPAASAAPAPPSTGASH